jgi:S1-C subfamily serine protease
MRRTWPASALAVVLSGVAVLASACVGAPQASTAIPSAYVPPVPTTAAPLVITTTTVASTVPQGFMAPPTTSQALLDSLMAKARTWAFRVRSTTCLETGSSFAIAGHIVTNRHVAGGSTALQMSNWAGTDFNVNVAAISSGPDLALLTDKSVPAGTASATLASAQAPPGTAVWAAGYPEGDQLTLTGGEIIDYIDGSQFNIPGQIMEITNQIEPGNSGSALINSQGVVVGVVFALEVANHDGLAIPVSSLSAFLANPGSSTAGVCENAA